MEDIFIYSVTEEELLEFPEPLEISEPLCPEYFVTEKDIEELQELLKAIQEEEPIPKRHLFEDFIEDPKYIDYYQDAWITSPRRRGISHRLCKKGPRIFGQPEGRSSFNRGFENKGQRSTSKSERQQKHCKGRNQYLTIRKKQCSPRCHRQQKGIEQPPLRCHPNETNKNSSRHRNQSISG